MLAEHSFLELLCAELQAFYFLLFLLYNLFMGYCQSVHLAADHIADLAVYRIDVFVQLLSGFAYLYA